MSDLNHEIQFGSYLIPTSSNAPDLVRQAQEAESLGFDLIGVPDHPDWPNFLELWTLLSVIVARTESIHVFPDVVNLSLRDPAVVAKAAWSLDALDPGRVHLGLGAGWDWDGTISFGGSAREPREAFEHIEEAISVIRLLWSGEPEVSFSGKHYRLVQAKPPPAPPQPIDIWIGCGKPRMRRLIARAAEGWIPNGDGIELDNLAATTKHLDDAIVAAGRKSSDVRRICHTHSPPDGVKRIQPKSEGFLWGPASQWVEELTILAVEHGFDTFMFGDPDAPVEHLRQVAEEVMPSVRENAAAARGRSA